MKGVKARLGNLEKAVAELSGKVSLLPGYPCIAVIMTIVGGKKAAGRAPLICV